MRARNRRTGEPITRVVEQVDCHSDVVADGFRKGPDGVTHRLKDQDRVPVWETVGPLTDGAGAVVYRDRQGDLVSGADVELYDEEEANG